MQEKIGEWQPILKIKICWENALSEVENWVQVQINNILWSEGISCFFDLEEEEWIDMLKKIWYHCFGKNTAIIFNIATCVEFEIKKEKNTLSEYQSNILSKVNKITDFFLSNVYGFFWNGFQGAFESRRDLVEKNRSSFQEYYNLVDNLKNYIEQNTFSWDTEENNKIYLTSKEILEWLKIYFWSILTDSNISL